MPTIVQMLAGAKKAAAAVDARHKKAVAKRKSRAIKKAGKSKKRTSPVGLKALGIY